jgi:hypothetical protein
VKNLLQNNSSLPSELGVLCALAGVNSLCSIIPDTGKFAPAAQTFEHSCSAEFTEGLFKMISLYELLRDLSASAVQSPSPSLPRTGIGCGYPHGNLNTLISSGFCSPLSHLAPTKKELLKHLTCDSSLWYRFCGKRRSSDEDRPGLVNPCLQRYTA